MVDLIHQQQLEHVVLKYTNRIILIVIPNIDYGVWGDILVHIILFIERYPKSQFEQPQHWDHINDFKARMEFEKGG